MDSTTRDFLPKEPKDATTAYLSPAASPAAQSHNNPNPRQDGISPFCWFYDHHMDAD